MIRLSNLRVDYDNLCAVSDLSLEIKSGEVFGLIGPNGAGKTTTMRALFNLIEPTYGKIELEGIDIHLEPEKANWIAGFMPDFPPLYDDLYVWEFLDLFASSYFIAKPDRKRAIDEQLNRVGLTEKRNAFIIELSRGMRQRLMLAKTLLPNPKVVVLDEPASGMDPHGRALLKDIVRELASRGSTVLISSHILSELSEMCTSYGIMERGKLVKSGAIGISTPSSSEQSILVIEILSPVEPFLKILSDSSLNTLEKTAPRFEVPFSGSPQDAAMCLKRLVDGGVQVVSFTRKKETLEEIFLKVGAKELS